MSWVWVDPQLEPGTKHVAETELCTMRRPGAAAARRPTPFATLVAGEVEGTSEDDLRKAVGRLLNSSLPRHAMPKPSCSGYQGG